jgi:hypothetical protein
VTVWDALDLARLQGVEVTLDGNDLVLEAKAAPTPGLLAIMGRGKWDIVAALRLREAEERRRIVQWVNDHFASSPPGVCAHCGDGPRSDDLFVTLFVGNDRGEVHASCHGPWLAEREAEARRALGLEVHPSISRNLHAHGELRNGFRAFRALKSAERSREMARDNWTYHRNPVNEAAELVADEIEATLARLASGDLRGRVRDYDELSDEERAGVVMKASTAVYARLLGWSDEDELLT